MATAAVSTVPAPPSTDEIATRIAGMISELRAALATEIARGRALELKVDELLGGER